MIINPISFTGVKTVSIAQCSRNEVDGVQENDSTQNAKEILKKEDERLTAENIPHSTGIIHRFDRFNKEVKELNKELDQPEEMLPPSDYYDRPLVDVSYNIYTGQEYEGLEKITNLIEWFGTFKPNLEEKDPRRSNYALQVYGVYNKLRVLRAQLALFLDEYGQRDE